MKARLSGNYNRGVSTLELLIAFAVLTLSMSAVIMLVFGNQSEAIDTEINTEALGTAQAMLETSRALSRQSFSSVVSTTTTTLSMIPYTKTLVVADLTQCKKQVTSTVSWQTGDRTLSVSLATFLGDIAGIFALGGDCAIDPPPSTGWRQPDNFNSVDFNPSGVSATDVDVKNKIAFMSGSAAAANKPDFFIFDSRLSSISAPPVLSWSLNTGDGLNAVDAIDGGDDNYYIFAASNDLTTSPLKQLLVIREKKDLSAGPVLIASSTLPGVSGSCPVSCPQGRSVYYLAPYVYVGTHRTGGKEFHIFDVSNPTSPVWKGSIELTTNINDIVVKNQLVGGTIKRIAYLAIAGNSKDLMLLDVTNPTAVSVYAFVNVGGTKDAKVLDTLGTIVYVGKDRDASGPDLFAINVSNPASPVVVGSGDISMKPGAAIMGLRVVGQFAFIGTTDSTDPFQVWNIANPASMVRWDTSRFNFAEKMVSLDYEDDRIYTANQSNDALRIIYGP